VGRRRWGVNRPGDAHGHPDAYRTLRLNQSGLAQKLRQAPLEFAPTGQSPPVVMSLPMPDGKNARFSIEESPITEPGLATQFPQLKTYRGQGIDDPAATLRFDWTTAGFHAIVLSAQGTVYVDPYARGDSSHYLSYYQRDYRRDGEPFQCLVTRTSASPTARRAPSAPALASGQTLRTYRLALAATGEYTQTRGGTKEAALASMITTINRVDGIYERELAVRMVLINAEASIIYTDPATDPYTNNNGVAMLDQNQQHLDAVIGPGNYDLGHVFSTGGGGIAGLGVVCEDGVKAHGVTGSANPTGDSFDVDYVAHEIGHQFNANHTFNGMTGNCGGANRVPEAAYEPGSGSTIMAYAGICGAQNLQPHSDDYFHSKSFEEIIDFISSLTLCAVQTPTGNTPPTANAGSSLTIPRSTPFTLTATGSDANGDALTYCWEELDLGGPSPPETDADGQERPIFRSFLPTSSPSRTFPKSSDILANASTYGETLPVISRTMTFQVTVRDNHAGGGGVNTAVKQVTVDGGSGPFLVTQPNTAVSWPGGTFQTVTWNVANTSTPPVNCVNVRILLSTDGGNTFPLVLAASTPNDGAETVLIPNTPTTTARVKVEAVGNIFFDLSDVNFTITGCGFSIAPTGQNFTSAGGSGSVSITTPSGCNWTAIPSDLWITIGAVSGGSGNGGVTYSVAANLGANSRSGTIKVADQTFTIWQLAPGMFFDVPATHPFYAEISAIALNGITAGCGSGYYCPEANVTREQMAAFIIRALGDFNPPTDVPPRFADVPKVINGQPNPFYGFIDRMRALGITSGCGGGNYCPGSNVTREQMAAFIIRALGNLDPSKSVPQRFGDVPPTNDFYGFIDQMGALGITLGCGGGNYCPKDAVTRGQMAAFLVRAFRL